MAEKDQTKSAMILRDCVLGKKFERPPIWIMRQAGRYLPEYREIRKSVSGFLELCYTPELATEVTLQPLRRFELDAAILFSDILVIPDALGQKVWFETGEGPRLEEWSEEVLNKLNPEVVVENLQPVLTTVSNLRSELAEEKTLIGFCGAPWTVATYMIGGRGSADQGAARLFALQHSEKFNQLMDVLVKASAQYLCAQVDAGANVLQIFESWASNLDNLAFENAVLRPTKALIEKVRSVHPDIPIIGFPKGAASHLEKYAAQLDVNVVGVDFATRAEFVDNLLPKSLGVQGNLDPLRLVTGGAQMLDEAEQIIAQFKSRPHIFNLGHGIIPQTPIEHVEQLVHFVKTGERP